ncbi:Uncharacterised protein [Streptobacillus moniliformis]|nr:Uncharacterised protein [Streptobacillus moniliformis]
MKSDILALLSPDKKESYVAPSKEKEYIIKKNKCRTTIR